MTREDLIRLIYFSDYCPKYNCQPTTRDICQECCSKALTEYENEIYNKALIDVEHNLLQCIDNDYEYPTSDFHDCIYDYIKDALLDTIEQLTKGTDELKKGVKNE